LGERSLLKNLPPFFARTAPLKILLFIYNFFTPVFSTPQMAQIRQINKNLSQLNYQGLTTNVFFNNSL
jgi:hypothetical protein